MSPAAPRPAHRVSRRAARPAVVEKLHKSFEVRARSGAFVRAAVAHEVSRRIRTSESGALTIVCRSPSSAEESREQCAMAGETLAAVGFDLTG